MYAEFLHDRLMQKCLGFRLEFRTRSMDPTVRLLPHLDSLFEAFKVDASKYSEHAKPQSAEGLSMRKKRRKWIPLLRCRYFVPCAFFIDAFPCKNELM